MSNELNAPAGGREEEVFHFCQSCVVKDACCRSTGSRCALSAPVLSTGDLPALRKQLGDRFDKYVHAPSNGHGGLVIRTHLHGGCVFHDEVTGCKIYNARPFDCRIFPLDIMADGGRYYWIAYSEYCRKDIEWDSLLAYAEAMRVQRSICLRDYATIKSEISPLLAYKVLCEISDYIEVIRT